MLVLQSTKMVLISLVVARTRLYCCLWHGPCCSVLGSIWQTLHPFALNDVALFCGWHVCDFYVGAKFWLFLCSSWCSSFVACTPIMSMQLTVACTLPINIFWIVSDAAFRSMQLTRSSNGKHVYLSFHVRCFLYKSFVSGTLIFFVLRRSGYALVKSAGA